MMHNCARLEFVLFGIVALLVSFNVHADELYPDEIAGKLDQSHNFECIATYGECPTGFVAQGHYVYLSAGYTLRVLDIADPAKPKEVGWLRVAGRIDSMIVNGPALYLATGQEGRGLKVIDISDPTHPRLQNTFDWNNMGLTAWRMGQYMYIDEAGKYGEEWGVYRISDPLKPVKIATGSRHGTHNPFCTDGDRFFQAIANDLPNSDFLITIRDLTTSATTICECKISYSSSLFVNNKTFLNDFDVTSNTISRYSNTSFSLPFSGKSHEFYKLLQSEEPAGGFMELEKTISFGKWRLTENYHDNFRLAPLNDPEKYLFETKTEPDLFGNALYAIKDGRLEVFDLSGDRLVECGEFQNLNGPGHIQVARTLAIVQDHAGLNFFNVSNPFKPTPVGNYRFHDGVKKVEASNNRAYLINGEDELEVLDISDPTQPRPIMKDKLTTTSVFASLVSKGSQAAERGSSGTLICRLTENSIDILDAKNPAVLRGQIKRPVDEEEGADYEIQMLGNALYYIKINHTPFPFIWPSFDIYDLSNPAAPKLVGHEGRDPDEVSEDSDWYFGPPAPAILSPAPPAKYPGWYLCLPHSHRTTGRSVRGFMIYDCSNALQPRFSGFYDRASGPVSLQKDKILIADDEGGLVILRHIGGSPK